MPTSSQSKNQGSGESQSDKRESPVNAKSGENGSLNSFLESLKSDDLGLTFRGIVITEPEVRSGRSRKSGNPYAIQSVKCVANKKTYILTAVRKSEEELPEAPAIGTAVMVKVESADKQSADSDIELSGEIVEVGSD